MDEKQILAERFEASRGRLRTVAHRMLGSWTEADDAVQEVWLRLMGTDTTGVVNFGGWLTTVVSRICLDMLRVRKTRREEPISDMPEVAANDDGGEREAQIADAVGLAMLVVLESLTPSERVAFVLHDMFDLSFDDVAQIVNRTPAAARQLASRARRRIQGAPTTMETDRARQREVVSAFLAASQNGDFSALLTLLDPRVVLRADATAIGLATRLKQAGGSAPVLAPEMYGAEAVANAFLGRASKAKLALIKGDVGLVFAPGRRPVVAFDFVIENGRIIEISLIADAANITLLDLEY